MNKSTAAFLGIDPATQMVDEIEFVVRMDDAGSLTSVSAGAYHSRDHHNADIYTRDLSAAHRFRTAGDAGSWIRKRQVRWNSTFGGRFSIVPVKVTVVPAVYKSVEVSPASTVVELF